MRFLTLIIGFLAFPCFSQQEFQSETEFKEFLNAELKIAEQIGAQDYEQKMSPDHCQADLSVLKWTLEEAQTTLYRYADKKAVDAAFAMAYEKAQAPLTYLEFIREIAKIQHLIACGHSNWSHAPDYFPYRNSRVGLFPFRIGYSGENCLILHDYSLENMVPDTAILRSVNAIPIDEIIAELKTFIGRDGTSNDRSELQAAKYFNMAYSNFIGPSTQFELEIQYPNVPYSNIIEVKALTKNEIDSVSQIRYPNWKERDLPLRLEIDSKNNAAFYTIEWFRKEYIKSKGQDFESFTDSVFTELKAQKIENLFIDLRGNTGGWTAYGKYLFAYFIDKPVPYMTNVVTNRYTNFSFNSIKLVDPDYEDSYQMELNSDGLYEWKNYPSLMAYPPKNNRFQGNTFILIDNYTRSCSGMFCSLMREHTKAIFIGEETGATQCGAGGMLCQISLPHSKIGIRFSTGKYSCAVKDPTNSRGVLPDFVLKNKMVGKGDFQYYLKLAKGIK